VFNAALGKRDPQLEDIKNKAARYKKEISAQILVTVGPLTHRELYRQRQNHYTVDCRQAI